MQKVIYSCIYITGVFVASFSQILLKRSALNNEHKGIKTYCNLSVITAYLLFGVCTLLSVYSLKIIPLSLGAIYESLGYIFIPWFSFLFFKERIVKVQVIGIIFIIIGVIICSI
jgi:multidrug transporter EmrE-like cation transporter